MSKKGNIAFDDLIVEHDDDHVGGCYRLEGEAWKIFYFTHRANGEIWNGDPIVRPDVVWPSGIQGIDVLFPAAKLINKEIIKTTISEVLGEPIEWAEVRGPDSLQMK